jgi:putative ABC transport system permease protein
LIVEGRWLLPEDENAIVVNTILVKEEAEVRVGQEILLKVRGKEERVLVVGVCTGLMSPMAYINYPYAARLAGYTGQATTAIIRTQRHDEKTLDEVASDLERSYERSGLRSGGVQTMLAERSEAFATYNIIISLLLIMACLLAVVGGLGLMGTMSINVLERTREIGVLRAIGASSRSVERVFMREGVMIGWLSWGFGAVLSIPMSQMMGGALGEMLMGAALTPAFSVSGALMWLALMLLLSVVASSLPARNASRLTIREVLSYE